MAGGYYIYIRHAFVGHKTGFYITVILVDFVKNMHIVFTEFKYINRSDVLV